MRKRTILHDFKDISGQYAKVPTCDENVTYYASRNGDIISVSQSPNKRPTLVSDVAEKPGRSRRCVIRDGWGYRNLLRENIVYAAWNNLPEVPAPKAVKHRLLEHINGDEQDCSIGNLRLRITHVKCPPEASQAYVREWNNLVGRCVEYGMTHHDAEDFVSECFILTLVKDAEREHEVATTAYYGVLWWEIVKRNRIGIVSHRVKLEQLTRHINISL